jgi:hypothetical protein
VVERIGLSLPLRIYVYSAAFNLADEAAVLDSIVLA